MLWTAGTSTPDVGLAGTKHVVYNRSAQRMWLIEADGTLFDTYPVSGRATSPAPGSYSVFSKSQYSSSPKAPVTMRHMVRFVKATTGLAIGFHSIPRTYAGLPIQTVAQLGQPRSAGCVRQDDTKAQQLFGWAPIGTPVVVVA
ncbi:L,D-transpeptidase [Candidatus Poriferisodalis sp.]|uniref:L,D-transpeptidase n=1 Tax=Candidatus Poriferisodalis sp. TaxID=3101277 RepID=UPI003B01AFDD